MEKNRRDITEVGVCWRRCHKHVNIVTICRAHGGDAILLVMRPILKYQIPRSPYIDSFTITQTDVVDVFSGSDVPARLGPKATALAFSRAGPGQSRLLAEKVHILRQVWSKLAHMSRSHSCLLINRLF